MPKGDDIERRKKNKVIRKKMNKESSVSARVAAIIATKKRRQTGRRSQCQGMCFSLPTPVDPYNDRQGKPDEKKLRWKKKDDQRKRSSLSTNGKGSKRLKLVESEEELQNGKLGTNEDDFEAAGVLSKFLVLCLKSIQDALLADGGMDLEDDTIPLFANPWGVDFWKCYSAGKNILETSGDGPNLQQIAWMVSTAADTIARKEKEGESFASPFLLYLVPSQEHATKVRLVCKPLKALGIHTVSLHPGALIDHQIDGLKSCEPEFLVATPERLWELISLKAIDISGVSLLVVDGLDMFTESGCQDVIKRIGQSISKVSRAVVFQGHSSVQDLNSIMTVREPFCKLSLDDSVKNKQARKLQSTHLYSLKEGKC